MLRATNLLVTLNRIAARNPDSIRKIEEFLARDLEVTAPLAIEVAIEEGDPMGRALANVLERHADLSLSAKLSQLIPERTTSLRELAVITSKQLVDVLRSTGASNLQLAAAKIKHSRRCAESARYDDAMIHLQTLIPELEHSYTEAPEEVEALLAAAHHIHAGLLIHLRRLDEALVAGRRAVELFTGIEHCCPGRFPGELAISLNGLAYCLTGSGLLQEAFSYANKAIAILERMEPSTGVSDALVASYQIVARLFLASGAYRQSLEVVRSAISVIENIHEQNEDTHSTVLAGLLLLQSVALRGTDALDDAILAVDRAVFLYSKMGADHRDAIIADLQAAEINLSSALRHVGRFKDGLKHADLVVRRWMDRIERGKCVDDSNLASALCTQAVLLGDMGRFDECLAVIHRSLDILERGRVSHQQHSLPLITGMHILETRAHCVAGREFEALLCATKAFSFFEAVKGPGRKEVLPTFLLVLSDLAALLTAKGKLQDSMYVSLRSITLYNELDPLDLKSCLMQYLLTRNSVSIALRRLGKGEDALSFTEQTCRQIQSIGVNAIDNSRLLASMAFAIYSDLLVEKGFLLDAASNASRHVELVREQHAAEPRDPRHLKVLVSSLMFLSIRLRQCGNLLGSSQAAEEAARVR